MYKKLILKVKENNIYKLLQILSWSGSRRKRQLYFLFIVMLISGLSEAFLVAGIQPFLSILLEPENIKNIGFFSFFINLFRITEVSKVVIFVFSFFILITIFSGGIRLFNSWLNNIVSALFASDLSSRIYKKSLYQSYEKHVLKNSSETLRDLSALIDELLVAFMSLFSFLSAFIVLLSLIFLLLAINWKIAIFSGILLCVTYYALVYIVKNKLRTNSEVIVKQKSNQLKAIQEGLGSLRDVILDNSYMFYLNIYRRADKPLRISQAENSFLNSGPKYAVESLGLIVMLFISAVLFYGMSDKNEVIPLLGVIALSAQKLLPTSHLIFNNWSKIKGRTKVIDTIYNNIKDSEDLEIELDSKKAFNFQESIVFKDVSYKYRSGSELVLKSINFQIKKGEKIGIVGQTGSGKSTLIDLIIGILKPTYGEILIDGYKIREPNKNEILRFWRNSIAHIPQDIYLSDATIAENIAFGIDKKDVNLEAVKFAAKQARIDQYIESMPNKYQSYVGERGVRLSGGQRQRIAIARCLYKKKKILVFDEATSALDIKTEKSVIDSINELSKELTVIFVTHRLITLKNFDRIIQINNGVVDIKNQE